MTTGRNSYEEAVRLIRASKYTVAYTGAGISVESGIPPFRGKEGLWNRYDPMLLDINYFQLHPEESWAVIKKIFYDFFGKAKPNTAHKVLARMEQNGLLNSVITQNIDNLHQDAGSQTVREFHGNSRNLVCINSGKRFPVDSVDLTKLPPRSEETGGLLKPDFIFFGEGIPQDAYMSSIQDANNADVFIIIGTTGEIMPASQIPFLAKQNGAKIIEVNVGDSNFTNNITDIYIQGKATEVFKTLENKLFKN
ncbi:MAG: Sir2 family NAD-dependent protein deacetylase [Bacteroidales bacterium]